MKTKTIGFSLFFLILILQGFLIGETFMRGWDEVWESCDTLNHDTEAYHDCRQQNDIGKNSQFNKDWYIWFNAILIFGVITVFNPLNWLILGSLYYGVNRDK